MRLERELLFEVFGLLVDLAVDFVIVLKVGVHGVSLRWKSLSHIQVKFLLINILDIVCSIERCPPLDQIGRAATSARQPEVEIPRRTSSSILACLTNVTDLVLIFSMRSSPIHLFILVHLVPICSLIASNRINDHLKLKP